MWTGLWVLVFVLTVMVVFLSLRLLRAHSLARPGSEEGRESLSVILAAHDEAPRIAEALGSVLAQDHPDLEVIVVDDRSSDGTGEVARQASGGDPRLRVLRTDRRPPGWQGRLHAQDLGVQAAVGEWLFFLSADQRLTRPDVLRAAVAECRRRDVQAISVLGRFVGRRWWERLWFHPIINNPIVWGTFLGMARLRRSVWLVGALTMRRSTCEAMGGVRAALSCGAGAYDDMGWSRAFAARGDRAELVVTRHLEDFSNWDTFSTFLQGLTRWLAGIFTYRRGGWVAAGAFGALLVATYVAIGGLVADVLAARPPAPAGLLALGFALVIGVAHYRWNRESVALAPVFLLVGIEVLVSFVAAGWAGLRNRAGWRDDELLIRVPNPLDGAESLAVERTRGRPGASRHLEGG
jgi:glycosyltransferase involved in cell wall biosynthesis